MSLMQDFIKTISNELEDSISLSVKECILKSELVHEVADLKFYKFDDGKQCVFFSVDTNSPEEILDMAETPSELFLQYDPIYLNSVTHKIPCSREAFLVGFDYADEVAGLFQEDRDHANLINIAKLLNIPIIFNNPDLGDFEVCILFPISELLDFPDLDPDEQDSFLADCDDDEEREECMTVQYAKLSAGGGSRNIVGLKDFMRCCPGFWDRYSTTSNTGGGYLIKFWNDGICTLIHA